VNVRSEILGVNRQDMYEIPIEVLREASVNALMHRDYSITGTQVSVEVFDDRVEIVNPGGLPKGLSVRDLGTVSSRRNELVSDLFFRLHKELAFKLAELEAARRSRRTDPKHLRSHPPAHDTAGATEKEDLPR